MLEKDAGCVGVFQEVEQSMGQTWAVLREEGADGGESSVTQRRKWQVFPLNIFRLKEGQMQLLVETNKNVKCYSVIILRS